MGESPVRVCHIITTLDVGGAERALSRLVASPCRRHAIPRVVSLTPSGVIAPEIERSGVPVATLNMHRGRPSLRALGTLVAWLRADRPHLVQTWMYHADLMGWLAARMSGIRRVIWNVRASDLDLQRYRWLSGFTVRACARLSTSPEAVVFNSRSGLLHHGRLGYRPRQSVIISNGIDTNEFRPDPEARRQVRQELGVPGGAPIVGLVARFDPMKGHDTFLAAAEILAHRGSDAHFLLAGQGVEAGDPVFAGVLAGPLRGRLHCLGQRDDIPRLMASCDVGVLSSRFGEGFPNVVAEFMACGVPCVVTDVGDAAEILGDAGLVVPPDDAPRLAAAIVDLLSSPHRLEHLGASAQARIKSVYTMERFVAGYDALYEGLA